MLEEIDDRTFILNLGELNSIDVSKIYPRLPMKVPDDATPGDRFTLDITYMDNDTEILTGSYEYVVSADETVINFQSNYDEKGEKLSLSQNFLSSYKFTGKSSKEVSDLTFTVDVPDDVVPKRVLNGFITSGNNVKKVEYFDGVTWQEAPQNSNGNFDFSNTTIKKIKVFYNEIVGTIRNYQPFRIEWEVNDSASVGMNFSLSHTIEYTDYEGIKQTPDVSSQDLTYEIMDNVIEKEGKPTIFQYNKTSEFDKGTVSTGDAFKMNYRLGAAQGKIDNPYIFVKLPKGIEMKNTVNTIQYPYADKIGYDLAPNYGVTVTPISKASNVGSFEAADGNIVYYFKADDTSLTREDYLQMLFIENEYVVNNIKSGIYEVEVGMGSLTENYTDATLDSGYTTSALSAEMKTKLGSAATTYYSKKTKLTVGKIDKVTTGVSVKGSEDAAWLDSSKTGKVVPGKKVSYRISIKNEGTENYSNVQLVNILPYINDNLVSSPTPRGSQFQINPDSGGVSVKYNGGAASGISLDYAMSNNPIRFSSPDGALIGTDPWTGSVSDFSQVRAIRVSAPFVTLKPGDEITMEYSGVVVLDAKRPVNPGDTFVANNSVAYRFQTADGSIRAGEPAVTKVETVKAEKDGLVSGNVYIDLDKDGSKGGNEPGLNQVQFELFKETAKNSGKFVSTGLTSESSSNLAGEKGIFGFTDLEYGTYKVKVTLPSSKGAAFITTGTDKVEKIDDTTAWVMKNGATEFTIDDLDISLGSNKVDDLSVALFVHTPLNGTISFKNKDGDVVASDYGKGFKVELYKGSTQIAETTSKANGTFVFDDLTISSTDSYKVKITMPSGKTFVFTTDNSAGEITIDMEPGVGTTDPTDLYITDTDMPLANIALVNGRGTGNDVNPDSITLTASDRTTSISTDWKITKGGTTEYSGTSTDGSISLEDQINYLIGDKKVGDYTVEMTVTDFAGNQTTVSKNFSIKFGNVKYMSEGSEYAKEEDLLLYVDKLTKPATDPTKTGYVFDKWVKASDKSEWNFSTGAISEENLVLEATFKAAEQKIRFDVNGGDVSTTPPDIEKDTGDTVDLSKVTKPTRTGYTFNHWYRQGDAGKTNVGASVVMPVGGMTLVADWSANSYEVSFDKNDGTGTMADQSFKYDAAQNLTANTFTREGYSFQGWSTTKTGAAAHSDGASVKNLTADKDGSVTLYAIWKADSQMIQFDVNGGDITSKPANISGDTDSTVDLKDVKAPTRMGYTFKHWYKQGDAGKADVGNSVKMPAKGMTLVAEWTANSYTVTFDKNDGTGTMANQSFKYDTAQNLSANKFTREGYSFQGWSTTKTGAVVYVDSASAKNLTADKDGSVTLYAIWKADSQVIQFDVNGGDIASKPGNISSDTDSTVDLKDVKAPTRIGYTFKHWYKSDDAGKADVGNSVKMPAKGMTLVAEWEANSYTVNFHNNTGTGTMTAQSFKYDEAKKLTKNTFTKEGYNFVGWSTTANGASAYTDEALVTNLTDKKDGSFDLYALWSADAQVIQFDVNGGDVASKPANIDGNTDDTIDLKDVKAPTRTGYTFKHWYKSDDAGKTDVGTSVKMPAKGMTLVAQWEANSYTVTFDKNEGTGTMAEQNFKYDTAKNLSANKFTRAGYSFQGWSTKNTGTVMYAEGASVSNLTDEKDGTVTLYAIWKADSQAIQFDVNGGDVASKPANIDADTDSTVDLKDVKAPTRTGYTFKHWYKQGDADKKNVGTSVKMPANGMTLVAEWEANSYSVKFHNNTGTGTMTDQSFKYDESKKLTKNSFTKAGYTFDGWATAANAASAYTDEQSVSNLTDKKDDTFDLYAIWSADAQVIQFDVNGGDVASKPANINGNTDETIDLKDVKAPTRTGYTFKHWYKSDDAGKADVGNSVKMPAKGMTLVAEWEANTYKVKFNANGGTETMNDQNFVYDKGQALTENNFKRAGYTFAGWSTTATGTASYADKATVSNLTATDKEVVELFAVWTADNQTIQFDVNGGTDSSKPADIVAGTDSNVDLSKVKAPTRKGYTFNHWYKKDDAAKTAVTGTITMPVGGMILVADWKANDYKVKFDANEGTGTMADQDFVYDTEQKLTANAFDRTNYDFVGWSTTKTGKVEFADEEAVKNLTDEEDGSKTLYAVWKIQERVISFDVNGGDGSTQPADIQKEIGEKVNLDDVTAPTREGYSFAHWYKKDDAAKTAVTGTITMPDTNMVLVAAWNANHYKVTFDANGGTGTMKDQAFVYDTAQELTGNTFERKNYDFIGWATEKEGVVTYYDKESVNNLTTKDSDTITLYAIWEKKAALPVIKANNIVMTTKQVDDYTKANTLERKIAELADAKVVDENTSDVIATHEKVSIDHSNVVSKQGVYKAHVSYETKARALVESKEIDVTVIDPTTTQKITFDVNGGDEKTKPADISAKVGTTVSLKDVKAPTRSGYSFTGWYNGETKVGDTFEMPENGMTLVAHWSQGGGNGSNGGSTGSGTTNTNVLARTGTTSTGKSLPQTNDTSSIGLSLAGMMLAVLAFFGLKKKKDEESETESK